MYWVLDRAIGDLLAEVKMSWLLSAIQAAQSPHFSDMPLGSFAAPTPLAEFPIQSP